MAAELDILINALDRTGPGTSSAKKNILGLNTAAGTASKGIGSLAKVAGVGLKVAAGVGAAGIGALAFAFRDSVSVAKEQINAEKQLNAVLKSTGGAAGLTAKELKTMASELQGVTNFGDEAIIAGESLLLTFTNIGKDVFPAATETMLDMSQALGQDMKSSAVQLGKALNDPILGITALSRVGVSFTEQQKEMIEAMVDAGDVAGAQKVILAELAKEFGGSARALADPAIQLQNAWGDLKEEVGKAVIPMLNNLARKALPIVQEATKKITGFVEKFNTAIGEGKSPLDAFKAAMLGVFGDNKITRGIQKIIEFAGYLLTAVKNLFVGQTFFEDSPKWVLVLRDVGDWIRDTLVPILKSLYEKYITFVMWAYGELWEVIKKVAAWMQDTLFPILKNLYEKALPFVVAAVETLSEAFTVIQEWMVDTLFPTLQKLYETVLPYVVEAYEALSVVVTALHQWFVDTFMPMWNKVAEKVMPAVSAASEALSEAIQKMGDIIKKVVDAVKELFKGFGKDGENVFATRFPKAFEAMQKAFQKLKDAIQPLVDAVVKLFEGMRKETEGIMNKLADFWEKHGETIMRIWDNTFSTILEIVSTVLAQIIDVVTFAIQVLTGDWEGAGETLERMTTTMWDSIKTIIGNTLDSLQLIFGTILESIRATVEEKMELVKSNFIDPIAALPGRFTQMVLDIIAGLIAGFQGAVAQVAAKITEIKEAITSPFTSLPEKLKQMAIDAINGFIQGIGSKIEDAKNKVRELLGLAAEAAEAEAEISSPSKRWMRIGAALSEGLIEGLSAGFAGGASEVGTFITSLTNQIQDLLTTVRGLAAGIKDALGGIVLPTIDGGAGGVISDSIKVLLVKARSQLIGMGATFEEASDYLANVDWTEKGLQEAVARYAATLGDGGAGGVISDSIKVLLVKARSQLIGMGATFEEASDYLANVDWTEKGLQEAVARYAATLGDGGAGSSLADAVAKMVKHIGIGMEKGFTQQSLFDIFKQLNDPKSTNADYNKLAAEFGADLVASLARGVEVGAQGYQIKDILSTIFDPAGTMQDIAALKKRLLDGLKGVAETWQEEYKRIFTGRVRAEDGSWVDKSFYSRTAIGEKFRPSFVPSDWLQAEDGSWNPPEWWGKTTSGAGGVVANWGQDVIANWKEGAGGLIAAVQQIIQQGEEIAAGFVGGDVSGSGGWRMAPDGGEEIARGFTGGDVSGSGGWRMAPGGGEEIAVGYPNKGIINNFSITVNGTGDQEIDTYSTVSTLYSLYGGAA